MISFVDILIHIFIGSTSDFKGLMIEYIGFHGCLCKLDFGARLCQINVKRMFVFSKLSCFDIFLPFCLWLDELVHVNSSS